MSDDRLVLAQVTVTTYLDETVEGGVDIEVDYSDGLPLIEAMGLLTYATLNIQDDYFPVDDDHN